MFWSKNINKNNKKIIIIGGGLSGLCAGIQALKKGHEVIIIEKESQIGGKFITLNNDLFRYYPKYVNGKTELFYLLKDLEVDCNKYLINNEILIDYINLNNERFTIYNNFEDFKQWLYTYSINDDKKIKELLRLIEDVMSSIKVKGSDNKLFYFNESNSIKYENRLIKKLFNRFDNYSIANYFECFNSKIIKEVLCSVISDKNSMSSFIMHLSYHFNKDTIILKSELIEELVQKYKELSGKILLSKTVKEFSFDKMNHVDKVILEDKNVIEGDYFISTIDPYFTYEQLLKKRFGNRKLFLRYEDFINYEVDYRQIYAFAINKDFHYDSVICQTSNLKINTSFVSNIKFIKGLCKNTIFCEIKQNNNDYDYLKIISERKSLNSDNHQKNIKEINKIFKNYFPEYSISYKESFNMLDLENSFRGAMKGFINTPNGKTMNVDGIISGLNNVMISSSWLRGDGGILNAIVEGKFCIERLEKVIQNEKK